MSGPMLVDELRREAAKLPSMLSSLAHVTEHNDGWTRIRGTHWLRETARRAEIMEESATELDAAREHG